MVRLLRLSLLLVILAVVGSILAGCNLNASTNTGAITGAPVVQIVSPEAGTTYLEGVAVNVQAQITNAGADIDRVEIALDDVLLTTLSAPNEDNAAAFALTHGWTAAGVGEHKIAVTAFRGDGSASEPASVTLSVMAGDGSIIQSLPSPAAQETQPTRMMLPSVTPRDNSGGATAQPTVAPTQAATATSVPTSASGAVTTAPTASFNQSINVRRGPGLEFDPPIGSFAAGQTTTILAVSTSGDWYKVRYGGGEGWVFSGLTTVSGDTSSLPRDPGPPRPTPRPVTATPVVATQASAQQTGANLVAGNVTFDPPSPTCNQTFTVRFDVANLGTEATNGSGTVTLVDARAADGSVQGQTVGGFPVIQVGQTFRVDMPMTISTWYAEQHRITLTIDQANQIPESNSNDNGISVEYTLNRGDCP